MAADPRSMKLIQLPAFLKRLAFNALTTENTESTEGNWGVEGDFPCSSFLCVFSVVSVNSVVNARELAIE